MVSRAREISDYANKQTTKNVIINGNFDIWQRGFSLAPITGLQYLADRFVNDSIGTTFAPGRQAFVLGQTDVPGAPKFYYRAVVASVPGINNYCNLGQSIENVRTFAGQTITLSFWAKADSPKNISTEYSHRFGTGGATSGDINSIGVNTHSLTTAWQKFTTTVDITSVSGETIGTNNDDSLKIHWWFDAGSNFDSRTNTLGQQSGTFDIAQIQIERGGTESDFESRTITQELILCQRYYQKSFAFDQPPIFSIGNFLGTAVSVANSAGQDAVEVVFPVIMRTPPTFGTINPFLANNNWRRTDNLADGIVGGLVISDRGCHISMITGSPDGSYIIHWTADAEL